MSRPSRAGRTPVQCGQVAPVARAASASLCRSAGVRIGCLVASLASSFVLLIPRLRSDERPQLIIEGQVQVAEAAGLPELHLPDSKLGQAILRAMTADDHAKLCLVSPGRTVR